MEFPILLCTLNATYFHCAFGLRYLFANLGELQSRAKILEFTLDQKPTDIAEQILLARPKVVGFGVYIWNTRQTEAVIGVLKRLAPELQIVLGGPEVSYEWEGQSICNLADFIFQGESEFSFRSFCEDYLNEDRLPSQKFISSELPNIKALQYPYPFYSDEDIAHRVIYVEASRGCPYKCEFCLSSLDKSVRNFPTDTFLGEIQTLIDRGARSFKFVDRTFNLSASTSTRILQFFLDRIALGLFLHFELVPDRLPSELSEIIEKFPPGTLQFEIGVQTWSPSVTARVSRRQDYEKVEQNFRFLKSKTGVHLHADLIAGLPGEDLESFARGFDKLASLEPHEIQVGILKRLKGTPILRHDTEWGMVYQDEPPFTILQTKHMDFPTLQKMNRFAKFWDLYSNSGNFTRTMDLVKRHASASERGSLFWLFWEFTDFLRTRHVKLHSIALVNLTESLWLFFKNRDQNIGEEAWREALVFDYTGKVKRDIPRFLRDEGSDSKIAQLPQSVRTLPSRQSLHQRL